MGTKIILFSNGNTWREVFAHREQGSNRYPLTKAKYFLPQPFCGLCRDENGNYIDVRYDISFFLSFLFILFFLSSFLGAICIILLVAVLFLFFSKKIFGGGWSR